ncbi:CDP-alcohol phosphatidyltransferase family protein [bacterium]|nr:CDP-alcohol phosphatidyltransferase family protein [bacterium]
MKEKITLPTYITLTRFLLVPVFIYLFLQEKYWPSVIVLGIASITDFLDGLIARKFNMRSKLGSMLDPLADKFLMLLSFIALSKLGRIPWELTILIVFRDFGIVFTIFIFLKFIKIKLYYKPTRLSKWATFSQIMVLVLSFLDVLFEKRPIILSPQHETYFMLSKMLFTYGAIIFTVITYFQYIYMGYKFYRYGEREVS